MSTLLDQRRAKRALLVSVGVTGILYLIPFGSLLAYPLVLLSTLAHEMAHGMMAELVGGDFQKLVLYSDASGAVQSSGNPSRLSRALVAGAGLVGPAIGGAGCFLAAKRGWLARASLVLVALLLGAALILVVRNLFGWIFIAVVAGGALAIGLKASRQTAQVGLVFVGTQLALSVFSRSDYLFTDTAQTAVGAHPSDVAQIADALAGPYWLWGALAGLLSLAVLWGGLRSFLRGAAD